MALGLEEGTPPDYFRTLFIMTYHEGGCGANCAFCPQAVDSDSDPKLLSRIGWPKYSFDDVMEKLENFNQFDRICIQSLNYPEVVNHVRKIATRIRSITQVPLSVCMHPVSKEEMQSLKDTGISNIGIAIDACTQSLFDEIKGTKRDGPYTWSGHINAILQAQSIFGRDKVTTHLIVGLGETEQDAAQFLLDMKEIGVRVGLFAFTNIRGTGMENIPQPSLAVYRRIQILRNLLIRGNITSDQVSFDEEGKLEFNISKKELRESLSSGSAFRVTGCPGCNRPFYNERPRGPMYNYPRPLKNDEIEQALIEAGLVS